MLQALNIAFMGSNIVEGEALGLVIATGSQTQLSKVASLVSRVTGKQTSLQNQINRFVGIIATLAAITVTVVILEWTLYLRTEHPRFMTTSSLLANCISVVVAYVPEGLPLALSGGLTIIAQRLCKKHSVLVKRLGLIETLGSCSMICTDKTGTLTLNRLTVSDFITADVLVDADSLISQRTSLKKNIFQDVLLGCIMCNQAKIDFDDRSNNFESNIKVIGGNGVDRALLQFSIACGEALYEIKRGYICRVIMPFSSVTKLAASVVTTTMLDATTIVIVKGAPEYVLRRCSKYLDQFGQTEKLSRPVIERIMSSIELMSCQGKRVIALAKCILTKESDTNFIYKIEPSPNFPLEKLTFIACIAFTDPPRPGANKPIL